jgi:hypothetical protein
MPRPQHTTDGQYTNPEVRFEHSDANLRTVINCGLGLAALVVVSMLISYVMYRAINRQEDKRKKTDLPPAAVDATTTDRLPPEPRLEAFDDIREHNVKMLPPRAEEYFADQKRILAEGDPKEGVLPINEAMSELAAALSKRPHGKREPPPFFSVRLPSKAASGRLSTGGQ